ncbi:MAG TPA: imidazole glycerol phosphate synthase subunit HisH, partial [Nitrospirae bacterium]|nr:imidazole glycerol phosphate synthase subunit HisH [Nitrospirota bacterium]
MGNLESVRQAFASVGVDCSISSDPCHFEDID